jgi:hypothetical protein
VRVGIALLLAALLGAPPAVSGERPRTLAAAAFRLPAANAFGEPGFHEVLTASGRVPRRLGRTAGLRLVVELRDASRPGLRCSSEHPLSGCATVDWSDDPRRPSVPPSGVFRNALTLRLATGPRTFYLRESGALARSPDRFRPG